MAQQKIEIAKMTLYVIGCPEFDAEDGEAMIIKGALDHIPVIYRLENVQKQTVEVDDFDDSELNSGLIDDPVRFDEILHGAEIDGDET